MSQNEEIQSETSDNSTADALAAVSVVLLPVVAIVFYLSGLPS